VISIPVRLDGVGKIVEPCGVKILSDKVETDKGEYW
jgi:hypothetical protein